MSPAATSFDVQHPRDVARVLADAAASVAGSADLDATLKTLSNLAVPALADGCWVDVLEPGDHWRRAAWHAAPGVGHLVESLARPPSEHSGAMSGPPRQLALLEGKSVLLDSSSDPNLEAVFGPPSTSASAVVWAGARSWSRR